MGARKARRSARGSLGKLVGDLRPDGGGVHPFLFREPRADAEGLTRPAVKAEKSSNQAVEFPLSGHVPTTVASAPSACFTLSKKEVLPAV